MTAASCARISRICGWRKSVEQAQSTTFRAIITAISGVLGALWLGFKSFVGK